LTASHPRARSSEVQNPQARVQSSGYLQFNKPFKNNFGQTILGGAAIVSVTSGSGVTAYASVIDNGSNDPTTIPLLQ
jgi:hypothetical protein